MEKSYTGYIKALSLELERRDIDYDPDWKDEPKAKKNMKEFFSTEGMSIKSSIDFEMRSEQYWVFLKGINDVEWSNIAEGIKKKCEEEDPSNDNKYIIVFVDSLKERMQQEERWRDFIKKHPKTFYIKGKGIGIKKSSFICVVKEIDPKTITLSIDDVKRAKIQHYPEPMLTNAIEKKSKKSVKRDAYVLTVKLKSILDLYTIVGDRLFKKNVRYDIGETLGVDTAIKETLKEAPEMFWYCNNGITIMVEDPEFKLDYANKIVLHRKGDRQIRFSVINGAQTINAAANLYYSNDPNRERLEEAYVLLRIIHIVGDNNSAEKVSVALNRQKPITPEDIACFSPFVKGFNECTEELLAKKTGVERVLYLIKRGEVTGKNCMTPARFVRAVYACRMRPEIARNDSVPKYLSELLQGEDETATGQKKDSIFVNWSTESFDERESQYLKNYGAANFANKLEEKYKKEKKHVSSQDEDLNFNFIIRNAGWYFVSIVLYKIGKILSLGDIDTGKDGGWDYTYFPNIKVPDSNQMRSMMKWFGLEICNNVKKLSKTGTDSFKESDLKGTEFREKYLGLNFSELEKSLREYLTNSEIAID